MPETIAESIGHIANNLLKMVDQKSSELDYMYSSLGLKRPSINNKEE